MGPLMLILVSLSLLLSVAIAFWWQERSTLPTREVVYGVEDALEYVMVRLSAKTRESLGRHDVRRILEWELRYLQDPSLRGEDAVVVGGFEAAQYAQEQALAQGYAYDGEAIIEVLDLQGAYLSELGAVGDPVTGEEGWDLLDGYRDAE